MRNNEPIYYPIDTWGETKEIFHKAKNQFDSLKNEVDEIYLIMSTHPYSTGFWIEFKKPKNLIGYIIYKKLNHEKT